MRMIERRQRLGLTLEARHAGGQQGLVDNLQRLLQRGKTELQERPPRLANESVVVKKEE